MDRGRIAPRFALILVTPGRYLGLQGPESHTLPNIHRDAMRHACKLLRTVQSADNVN
jgi:hypothetical protein